MRALRLSESSSVSLGLFLQVSPRRDRFAWAKTSHLVIVLPTTTIHSYPNNKTIHHKHSLEHSSLEIVKQ